MIRRAGEPGFRAISWDEALDRLGRELRGFVERAGFDRVSATSKYFSYGTPAAVEAFGRERADDCSEGWYSTSAMKHGLASAADLDAMRRAWLEWSNSRDAYLAFPWCRALGWKPG